MGKKEKSVLALTEDLQALIAMVPKLEAYIKVHNEMTVGYQKFRKNGGEAIPGVEKHLGAKKQECALPLKAKNTKKAAETKAPKKSALTKKVTTKAIA